MNAPRLLKLADHLENGKLGHETFDFSILNNTSKPVCGTAGCAIGECPIVFPDEWIFDSNGDPTLKEGRTAWNSVDEFFDVTDDESSHLFIPKYQLEKYSEDLGFNSTKEQVAANIRSFVSAKQKEEGR